MDDAASSDVVDDTPPKRKRKPRPAKSAAARKKGAPSHVQSVGADAVLYVPGRVVPAVVQILTVPVLTYFFTIEEIGRYDLTYRFVLFLSTFTFLWLNMGILRFYAPYQAREERVFMPVVNLIKYVATAFGVVLAVGVYLTNWAEPLGVYRDLLLPGVVLFIGYSFFETGLAFLRAKRRPLTYSFATTINSVFRLPLAISLFLLPAWAPAFVVHALQPLQEWGARLGMASLTDRVHAVATRGMGIEGMLWSIAVMYFVAYLLVLRRHTGIPGLPHNKERRKLLREILDYGLPIWLTQILNFFLLNADRWFIRNLATSEENGLAGVGLYSIAITLIDQPMVLLFQTLSLAVFPGVVAVWEKEGRAPAETLVAGLTRVYILLCLPLAVCFTVLARPLYEVLVHGQAQNAYMAAPWVASAAFFYGLSYFASFGLHLAKRTRLLLAMSLIALAVNLSANYVLIQWEGYLGAAHARLISNFVLTAALALAAYGVFRWRIPFKSFFRIFVAAVIAGLAAWFLASLLPANLATLSLQVTIGGGCYLFLLFFLREVDLAQLQQLGAVLGSRLRGK